METADVHEVLCVFAIMAFMGWYADAVAMKKAMKTIRIHAKYYPKKYIMRRKSANSELEKKEIPKWIYRTFLMSFVYIFVFVISATLILVLKGDAQIFVGVYRRIYIKDYM